jgi:hypothetical protein
MAHAILYKPIPDEGRDMTPMEIQKLRDRTGLSFPRIPHVVREFSANPDRGLVLQRCVKRGSRHSEAELIPCRILLSRVDSV